MTKYNGTAITYDAMGNPLSYRDSMRFTWENGRRLSCINSSSGNIAFRYNADGMRVQKENENYITNYYYDSSNNLTGLCIGGSTLFFYYDEKGSITAFSNNDIMYYYVKNMQGDIVKVVKEDGTVAANYVYDAWGKVLSVTNGSGAEISSSNTFHVANLNPFRYRGYMYDNETGLYYLQTRYYDPITGRFLNADDFTYLINYENVLSSNLYSYCCNNAINHHDSNGTFWLTLAYKLLTFPLLIVTGVWIENVIISVATSISNFVYNQQFVFNDYILDQNSGNAALIKMGFFSGKYNGCAWIATYNALKALGDKYVQPSNIISFFELWGCIFSGLFGVLPDAVADFFRLIGYKHVDEHYFPSDLDSLIRNYRATILFYTHSSGAHYIMVRYFCGTYYAYNVYNKNTSVYMWPSVDEIIRSRDYWVLHITGIK